MNTKIGDRIMATVKIWKVCYTPEIAFGYIQRNKVEVTEIEAVHDVFAYAERAEL